MSQKISRTKQKALKRKTKKNLVAFYQSQPLRVSPGVDQNMKNILPALPLMLGK